MLARRPFLALAGAVASAVIGLSAPASAQTPLKFSLDWKFEGPAAPFLLALEKGYYAEAGLDVSIDTGKGSLEAIPRVASGTYPMGFADINSLVKFRDQNPDLDVKAVMIMYNKPPFAIVGRKSLGVDVPKDLEGKTLGAPAPDGAYAQWAAFVAANDIDASKVAIENVGFPVREPMLARGEVQAITGFSFSSFINLKANEVPEDDISVLLMADYGLDLYGNAIMVNPDFAADNPDAVKGFIAATIKGLADVIANPEEGVEAVLKYNDVARKEVELERLNMALAQNILTDETAANGFGGVDYARFNRSIKQIAQTYDFEGDLPAGEDVFTDAFLPPADARMLQ
ncbi:MAG: ABC transporter substrate-binding protein [Geminicoccaceae bacterium]